MISTPAYSPMSGRRKRPSLAVNHQGLASIGDHFLNLAPGAALSDAVREINAALSRLHVPVSVRGGFQALRARSTQSDRQRALSDYWGRGGRRLYCAWYAL